MKKLIPLFMLFALISFAGPKTKTTSNVGYAMLAKPFYGGYVLYVQAGVNWKPNQTATIVGLDYFGNFYRESFVIDYYWYLGGDFGVIFATTNLVNQNYEEGYIIGGMQ